MKYFKIKNSNGQHFSSPEPKAFGKWERKCINGSVHMTKMAAMAINSKNLLNFSLEPGGK